MSGLTATTDRTPILNRYEIRELITEQDWAAAWPVLNSLRPYVTLENLLTKREAHQRDGTQLFGLIKDGMVASIAAIRIGLHLSGESELHVKDLVTLPQFRSLGLGAELMSHLETIAAAKGCFRLILHSAEERVDAHRFYERSGFHRHATVFIKELRRLY